MHRTIVFLLSSIICFILLGSFTDAKAEEIVVPGTLLGQASVGTSGSAQYSFPIATPAGTAGMEPKLFVTYDSNSGPSHFGLGWSLTGFSYISRTVRTPFIDGRPGAIDFDNPEDGFSTDGLTLDGARLVPAPEQGFLSKFVDDQTRIETKTNPNSEPYFIARTKAGLTIYFGETDNSRIRTDDGSIYVWAANKIEDTFGNQIHFFYENQNGDWGPKQIFYTIRKGEISPTAGLEEYRRAAFASVQITYGEDANPTTSYIGGQTIERSRFITKIESSFSGTPFRTYEFQYQETDRLGGRVLTSISETGAQVGNFPRPKHMATTFEYTANTPNWESVDESYDLPEGFGVFSSVENGYRFEDIDGDGFDEIIFSAQVGGRDHSTLYKYDGTAWSVVPDLAPPVQLSDLQTDVAGDVFLDLNGDDHLDLLYSQTSDGEVTTQAFLQENGKWAENPSFAIPFPISKDGERASLVRAVESTQAADFIRYVPLNNQSEYWIHDGNEWNSANLDLGAGVGALDNILFGKFDCGQEDLLATISVDQGSIAFFSAHFSDPAFPEIQTLAEAEVDLALLEPQVVSDGSCDRLLLTTKRGSELVILTAEVTSIGGEPGVKLRDVTNYPDIETGNHRVVVANITSAVGDEIILVSPNSTTSNVTAFSFNSSSEKWVAEPSYTYNPANSNLAIDDNYIPVGAGINGSNFEGILLLPARSGVATAALVNSVPGFTFNTDLVPPVHFAKEDTIGSSPQFIDLNADGLVDLVGYHLDKNGNEVVNGAFINTAQGWMRADNLRLPKPLTHEKGGTTGQFVDFNSDGIPDFLYGYDGDFGAWVLEFDEQGIPVKWVPDNRYIIPDNEAFSHPERGDHGLRFADVNADARIDLLIARREIDGRFVQKVYLNTGSGWSKQPADSPFNPPVPFVSRHKNDVHFETKVNQGDYYRNLGIQLTDLNADGAIDLVFHYRHEPSKAGPYGTAIDVPFRDGCLNTGKLLSSPNPQLTRYIPHPIPEGTNCAGVYYGTGTGWRNPGPGWIEEDGKLTVSNDIHFLPVPTDIRITDENASTDFADVNGDGLIDFIPARLANGENQYAAQINTGRGWVEASGFTVPIAALSTDKQQVSHRLIDLNGDGLLDIAFSRQGAKGTYLNVGYGWGPLNEHFAPPEPFIGAKGEDLGIRLVDVDGNGLPDFLRSWRDKNNDLIQSAYLNSSTFSGDHRESRVDILKSITNGMGATTRFSYRSLLTQRGLESEFYTPSPISPYPVITYVPTMYAVEQMTVEESDGSLLLTRYRYAGFRFDTLSLTPLGFERRSASNYVQEGGSQNNLLGPIVTEEIVFFQDFFRSGRIREERSIVGGTVLNETMNNYDVVPVEGSLSRRVLLSSSSASNRDLNGATLGDTSEFYQYDGFSNATAVCIEYGDGSRTVTHNSYDSRPGLADPRVWYLGRLLQAEVTHVRTNASVECLKLMSGEFDLSADNSLTRIASFEYDITVDRGGSVVLPDSTGVLTSETANTGSDLSLTKQYQYDQFGNKTVVELVASTGEVRAQHTAFDGFGRFPVLERNALGHETRRAYEPVLGLVVRTTDPNGISIENSFDGFGDLIETRSPTGLTSIQTRAFEQGLEVFGRPAAFSVSEQVGALPPSKTYYDNAGRALRIETSGFDGKQIVQVIEYDARGRKTRSSLPYFEADLQHFQTDPENTENPVIFTTLTYDDLNRVVTATSPDGGVTTSSYNGTTTSVTDALGATATRIVNLKGLTIRTVDTDGGELQFIYGPGDRLVKTIQADGLELINEYDQVGNKIRSTDPDLGQWDYRYNAFGEVIWQRDAKGQVTLVEYDPLGRPTRRMMPDIAEQFEYDSSQMGIGKPALVSNSQGYSDGYSYDAYGRLQRQETRIDREIFATSFIYDDYDRVVDTFYPANFRTKNEYTEVGFLGRVLANNPTGSFLDPLTVQWEATNRDQFGRVTEERFGNGVITSTEHNPTQGSVDRITVQTADQLILDLELEYDQVGNLRSKVEATSGRSEAFDYDNLYRISRWELNGATEAEYQYDQTGRITNKSDVGSYSYDGDGPAHGVSHIQTTDGEDWTYEYDANGNMVFGPKGHFEYNANNSVRLIYKSDNLWSKFWYAPDGSRYRQLFSQRKQIDDMLGEYSLVQTTTVGAYERIEDVGNAIGIVPRGFSRGALFNAFGIAPHGYTRDRLHIATDSGVVAILEANTQFDPLHGYHHQKEELQNLPIAIAESKFQISYVHTDELGSIVRITDKEGRVAEANAYDPWGKKLDVELSGIPVEGFAEGSFRRGFTGHEHLENLELVHMNGRVYDPDIARFISADVFLQSPLIATFYDRYSYVTNNPLKYVDPTGHFLKDIGNFFKDVGDAIARPFREAGRWLRKNWREVVVTVVAVAIVVFSGGTATPLAAVMVGAAAGAASAGLYVALYGGDINDVLFAAAKGAIIGGVSAGFSYGIGEMGLGTYQAAAGHGVTQGFVAEANGGRFVQGFLSGSFSSLAGSQMAKSNTLRNSISAQAAAGAVVGGTASVIGGGKFANGALSGTFTVVFNHFEHNRRRANAFKALKNYMTGGGNIEVDLDTVSDAFGIDMSKHVALASKYGSSIILIDENISFSTSGFHNENALGFVTVRLRGQFSSSGSAWYFTGEIRGYNDPYDFNPSSHRTWKNELKTAVGTMIPGKGFDHKLMGSVPVSGSGFLSTVH